MSFIDIIYKLEMIDKWIGNVDINSLKIMKYMLVHFDALKKDVSVVYDVKGILGSGVDAKL